MIAKLIIATLTLAAAASAENATTTRESKATFSVFDPSIDPNDMSCDPDGQIFLLLPHFYDCTKFFMCAHGQEVEFRCPGNTQFVFHDQLCQYPHLARCVLRSLPDVEGSGDEVNDNMIGYFVDEMEKQPVEMVASVRPISPLISKFNGIINCNRADEAARHVAYRGDCQRYWRCVAGVPQVAYCSDGLFFNEATQQCDFEANSKCNAELPVDELQNEFIVYKK